jgi:hypothetical protein
MAAKGQGRLYVFDTSAFIAGWIEQYPPDNFPGFWKKMHDLADARRLIAPEDVHLELKKGDEGCSKWLKERPHVIHQLTEEVQVKSAEVLGRFQKLTALGGKRGKADPFVVGLALVQRGTVVTKERHGPSEKNPKIPDACDGFNVPCFTLVQVIQEERWVF